MMGNELSFPYVPSSPKSHAILIIGTHTFAGMRAFSTTKDFNPFHTILLLSKLYFFSYLFYLQSVRPTDITHTCDGERDAAKEER